MPDSGFSKIIWKNLWVDSVPFQQYGSALNRVVCSYEKSVFFPNRVSHHPKTFVSRTNLASNNRMRVRLSEEPSLRNAQTAPSKGMSFGARWQSQNRWFLALSYARIGSETR
jgi:hypothetical protein